MINSKKLSVCVVAPTMPPLTGGAETFAEILTINLCKLNYVVHLITAEQPREIVQKLVKINKGSITLLGSTFESCDGYVGWEWAMFSRSECIHEVISKYRIDIVHALSHDTLLSASIALRGINIPPKLVVTTCEMSTEDTPFGLGRSRFIYNLSIDGLLQISQYYINIAKIHGCKAKNMEIAAAVDDVLFTSGNKEKGQRLLQIDNNTILISCPSRFSRRKGQLDLIEAIEKLPESIKNKITCLLAGSVNSASNKYLDEIKEKAINVGFKIIISEIDRENMPHILKCSDIVVLPSYKEGLGFSAIESMLVGCPLVLYNVSGFDEIPDKGDEVVFVPVGDINILTDKLEILISQPDLRMKLSQKGKKLAMKKFSQETFANKVDNFYQQVIIQ
jgi:glycosyltransferase involved in cell wall biosynthesis